MRLPGTGKPNLKGPCHFLTDFYSQTFELPLKPFINSDKNGYYRFYGDTPIKMGGKLLCNENLIKLINFH